MIAGRASIIGDQPGVGVRRQARRGSWRFRLAAMFLVSALAVPVAVLGGVVPALAGTAIQPVPGAQHLTGVVCLSATTCEVVGTNSSADQGVVVPIVNGAPERLATK